MKNLLILCGGQSPEHEISVRSTKNILEAIDRSNYQVSVLGITKHGVWRQVEEEDLGKEIKNQGMPVTIVPGKRACFYCEENPLPAFDVVFPLLHGPYGEDGTVQGLLKLLGLPFVGPGVASSSVAMDKDLTKRLLRDAGLKVAKGILLYKGAIEPSYQEIVDQLGHAVFVKPANMGSSVGVHKVNTAQEWKAALKDAFKYDRKVLIEELIEGCELECAVLGNENPQATGVGEVVSGNFYSYEEKYAPTSQAKIQIPAAIDDGYLPALKQTAIKSYQALDCQGMARVDMFLTPSGEIYVNEVNTIPGFTDISMYPKLWEVEGVSYPELIDRLIDLAIKRGR